MKKAIYLLLAALCALPVPHSASAVPLLKLEFKSLPDVFVQGATLDLPLYLVENRDASESSRFAGYPASPPFTVEGPFPLASLYSEISSLQSRFIAFTPVAGFDTVYNNFVTDHEIIFSVRSTNGIAVTIDNGGIIGRTEILVGTVRVEVGAPIPQDDGIGDKEPDAVFWADLSAKTNQGHNASLYLGPSGSNNQGELFLGGITASTYKIDAAPKPTEPGTFVVAPIKSYKSFGGTLYPNFDCRGPNGAICNGKAELFTSTKVKGKPKKTVYGKCVLPEAGAPNSTYCILKLSKAAKAILKTQKKLKASLGVTSTGVAATSKITVTIK